MLAVNNALLSVSDKTGLDELAGGLAELGVGLLSTGGTALYVERLGISVKEIAAYTGEAEMLDGRVKTLHPKVFAGILADRSRNEHNEVLKERSILPLDTVVVNFYPFHEAVAEGMDLSEAINKIDVGGPSMVRAAAKNHEHVVVLTSPDDYSEFLNLLKENEGAIPLEFSRRMALKAFALTSSYDAMVAEYFAREGEEPFPERLSAALLRQEKLRYGENPHQKAALYVFAQNSKPLSQKGGGQLSYNNHLDLDASWRCIVDLDAIYGAANTGSHCVAIFKHGNPCGASVRESAAEAFTASREANPQAAFGGVIAFNSEVDEAAAKEVAKDFYELICASTFSRQAIGILEKKEGLRILAIDRSDVPSRQFRSVIAGILVQEIDAAGMVDEEFDSVAGPCPGQRMMQDLTFAWTVAKHVKSNAIVLARDLQTLGVGAGQMSRVASARLACSQAESIGTADGAVAASDGFLPFPDTLEVLAEHGVQALVQPGGSKKDEEVIKAAQRLGIRMLFTGVRHFAH